MILHIRAIEARDLPKMDAVGKADPYLTFQLDQSPEIFKTNFVKQTFDPVWNEVFHIPIYDGKDNILHVELFDMDKVSADDLISTRDFEVNNFKVGEVTDNWFDFFAAPKAEKPGKVHLIFHLANPEDEPFVPKDLIIDQKEIPSNDEQQQATTASTQQNEHKDQEDESKNETTQNQSNEQTPSSTDQSNEVENDEETHIKTRDIELHPEKASSSSFASQSDRDDYEVFADSNLRPLSSTERNKIIEKDELQYSESKCKMILFIIIAVELLILFLKSKL